MLDIIYSLTFSRVPFDEYTVKHLWVVSMGDTYTIR